MVQVSRFLHMHIKGDRGRKIMMTSVARAWIQVSGKLVIGMVPKHPM